MTITEKERLLLENRRAFEAHWGEKRLKLATSGKSFRHIVTQQVKEWEEWLKHHPDPK